VTFDAKKVGRIRGQVKVQTNSDKVPTIDLWVHGEVLGNFDVSPRMISFVEPSEGQPSKQTIQVRPRNKGPFKVLGARDPEGSVEANVQKSADGWTIDLVLKRTPEKRRGTLEISTNDPEERTIVANYMVRRAGLERVLPQQIDLRRLKRPMPPSPPLEPQ